jgi:Fe-S cluster biosynthesis and repair protein YggX
MSDNPLNAQQIQQIQNEASKALQVAIDKMQLRKWAIEQAFMLATSPTLTPAEPWHPLKLAQEIYNFIVQPASFKIEIGS